MKGDVVLIGYTAPAFEDEELLCSCCKKPIEGMPRTIPLEDNANQYLEIRLHGDCWVFNSEIPFSSMRITTGEGWREDKGG